MAHLAQPHFVEPLYTPRRSRRGARSPLQPGVWLLGLVLAWTLPSAMMLAREVSPLDAPRSFVLYGVCWLAALGIAVLADGYQDLGRPWRERSALGRAAVIGFLYAATMFAVSAAATALDPWLGGSPHLTPLTNAFSITGAAALGFVLLLIGPIWLRSVSRGGRGAPPSARGGRPYRSEIAPRPRDPE